MATFCLALATATLACMVPRVSAKDVGLGDYQCKDPIYGDWTTFRPWTCGHNKEAVCQAANGDWTTWGTVCSTSKMRSRISGPAGASAPVKAPPVFPPSATVSPDGCSCDWSHGLWGCGEDDGSDCWAHCCFRAPGCDCNWAMLPTGCGLNDHSHCWNECCAQSNEDCDCEWAKNDGCTDHAVRDGSQCWDHCCLAYGGPKRMWTEVRGLGLSSTPTILLGCVAGLMVVLGATFAVGRYSLRRVMASLGLCSWPHELGQRDLAARDSEAGPATVE